MKKRNAPVFVRVGPNLYRYKSGTYYAFVKKTGRRIHRSLHTNDRKLAERRLADFKSRTGDLVVSDRANTCFGTLARHWLQVQNHTLSASTAKRKTQYVEAIEPFFNGMALRNIRSIHCEKWVLERGVDLSASSFNHELRIAIGILQKVLLPLTDVRHSAAVLREFGNLSSPTVLFVLQAALHGSAPDG